MMQEPDKVATWESRTRWVMITATAAFLVAYAAPIIWPHLPATPRTVCTAVTIGAWTLFIVDYLTRLWLSSARLAFIRHNILDLALLVLPMFRPLRLLRLLTALSMLHRVGAQTLRGKVITYATTGAIMLLLVASLAITDAERNHPNANITTVGDGLWWSITTMTTVGYGDRYPTTITGRAVAIALMIGGIALLGVVTGLIASWLVARVEEAEQTQDETQELVRALATQIAELQRNITRLAPPHSSPPEHTQPNPTTRPGSE